MNLSSSWGQFKKRPTIIILSFTVLLSSSANSQNRNVRNARLVGGPCEGCEAIFEYGDRNLSPVDTLPDFNDPGPKIKVTGTIYQNDDKTPAAGVILYIYHTDQNGIYAIKGGEATEEMEVTEFVENYRVRIVCDSHGTVWDSLFGVTSVDGQNELTLTMDANARKFMTRLMNPMIKGMLGRAKYEFNHSIDHSYFHFFR